MIKNKILDRAIAITSYCDTPQKNNVLVNNIKEIKN